MHQRLFSVAARFAALTVSAWGALLGIFVQASLTAKLHDQFDGPMDALNLAVLLVAALGYADLLWHDIRGRLIWPTFDPRKRHKVCVFVYSIFGGTWLLKAFVSASAIGKVAGAPFMAAFALSMAAICGLVAVALALEPRP